MVENTVLFHFVISKSLITEHKTDAWGTAWTQHLNHVMLPVHLVNNACVTIKITEKVCLVKLCCNTKVIQSFAIAKEKLSRSN